VNSTRQLAKRQMTWINNWNGLIKIDKRESPSNVVNDLIKKNI